MSISTKREYKGALSIKLIAIIASLYGIILNWKGLFSLTYFTNLSNIFMVCVLVWALVKHVKHLRNNAACASLCHSDKANALWYTIKFMATLSIMVTFSLYVFFLAPTNEQGFIAAFTHNYCASLCVHVIAPLFALADFLLFDNPSKSNKYTVWCGVIPPFCLYCVRVYPILLLSCYLETRNACTVQFLKLCGALWMVWLRMGSYFKYKLRHWSRIFYNDIYHTIPMLRKTGNDMAKQTLQKAYYARRS